jgi:ornithine cyclodeaminase
MIHLSDRQIDSLIDYRRALPILEAAFLSMGEGRAATQARVRTEAAGVKLSTLGAVMPDVGYVGAKVYTTIDGQFNFVIVLFSSADGRPLATLEAQSITRVRTAATTVLAARALGRPDARICAILGTGVQGTAHAEAIAELTEVDEIRIAGVGAAEVAAKVRAGLQRPDVMVRHAEVDDAIADADIIVTATRATQPLFDGGRVKPGAFIAAVGSSMPHTRELDNVVLRRASTIVVEWKEQARAEAGDLILAGTDVDWTNVHDLSAVLAARLQKPTPTPAREGADGIVVYKAVGIGLQDVAMAGLAYAEYRKLKR